MASEVFAVSKWLWAKIKSSTVISDFVGNHPTLKIPQIYKSEALQGSKRPYVVYSFQGGSYPRGNNGHKIFMKSTYLVKVIFEGNSSAPGEAIVNEFDKLFQQDQTKDDTVVIGCSISGPIEYNEVIEGGILVWHEGYLLDIFAYVVPN